MVYILPRQSPNLSRNTWNDDIVIYSRDKSTGSITSNAFNQMNTINCSCKMLKREWILGPDVCSLCIPYHYALQRFQTENNSVLLCSEILSLWNDMLYQALCSSNIMLPCSLHFRGMAKKRCSGSVWNSKTMQHLSAIIYIRFVQGNTIYSNKGSRGVYNNCTELGFIHQVLFSCCLNILKCQQKMKVSDTVLLPTLHSTLQ